MTMTVAPTDDKRELALLKAIGFDRLAPEQRELALNIASRYELDPLLKHLVLIEGRVYITRDGLLHVAHRSGALDGIVLDDGPTLEEDYWRATVSVYRKDMGHPFRYRGRYPAKGKNAAFGPEMAVKVAEVMALRRAFDVAAPAAEERWDTSPDVAAAEPVKPVSLAERVAQKAAAVEPPLSPEERELVERLSALARETSEPPTFEADPDEETWQAAAEAVMAHPGTDMPPAVAISRIEFLKRTGMAKIGKEEIARVHDTLGLPAAADMTDEQWGQLAIELGLA